MSSAAETEEPLAPRKKKVRNSKVDASRNSPDSFERPLRLVIVGGGIAGVCCAQELARLFDGVVITLVAAGDVLKESSSVMKITNCLEEVSVFERRSEFFKIDNPNIHVVDAVLERIDPAARLLHLRNRPPLHYDRVCLCTGARPSLLLPGHPRVLGLRDLETVQTLSRKLSGARRVVVAGNGGIALELVHALTSLRLLWLVREQYLGHAFFDASASAFIMPALAARLRAAQGGRCEDASSEEEEEEEEDNRRDDSPQNNSPKRPFPNSDDAGLSGGGVGPEWLKKSDFLGQLGLHRRQRQKQRQKRAGGRAAGEAHAHQDEEDQEEDQGSLQVECGQEICAVRDAKRGELAGEGSWWAAGRGASEGAAGPRALPADLQRRAEALLVKHLRGRPCRFPLYLLTTLDKVTLHCHTARTSSDAIDILTLRFVERVGLWVRLRGVGHGRGGLHELPGRRGRGRGRRGGGHRARARRRGAGGRGAAERVRGRCWRVRGGGLLPGVSA